MTSTKIKPSFMRLSEYGAKMGVCYNTVARWFHEGRISGAFQDPVSGSIFVPIAQSEPIKPDQTNNAILYARVSSATNKASLDGQIERLQQYAIAKGYKIVAEVKEIASGLNENRRQLNKIFDRNDYSILLVEHKDRLTRFGFNYIEKLLNVKGKKIEVIGETVSKDKVQELTEDFISIVTCFCGRLYGCNRKAKTQKIINDIKNEQN